MNSETLFKLFIIFSLSLTLGLFSACGKKDEVAPEVPQNPRELLETGKNIVRSETPVKKSAKEVPQGHAAMKRTEPDIVVPDEVSKSWSSVKLSIEDKKLQKKEEVVVTLEKSYAPPQSDLKIEIVKFLPDFKMDALTITSASNKPRNPAAKVKISEKDKVLFMGWLFSNYPEVHPFQHERFNILLKEGVKRN